MIGNFMTAKEAAEHLKCTAGNINYLCRTGKFAGATKTGHTWFIPKESVETYKPGPRGFAGFWTRVSREQARIKKAKLLEGGANYEHTRQISSTSAPC